MGKAGGAVPGQPGAGNGAESAASPAAASRQWRSFAEFGVFLGESGEDLTRLVYPYLCFGTCYWIPDKDSGFGSGTSHPWVIVVPYVPGSPTVVACPCTTKLGAAQRARGIVVPAGSVLGLDRESLIVPRIRRPFPARDFRDYARIGKLPDELCARLREALAGVDARVARESGA